MAYTHCNIKPELLLDKDGVLKDPILYEDLLKLVKTREIALNVYRMIDSDFLEQYGGNLKYDTQGMPTLSSLMKLPVIKNYIDSKVDNVLLNLNDSYKAGVYSYDEGILRAAAFNRNMNLNNEYLGTIVPITTGKDKGKVTFAVVKNTPQERRALLDTIRQRQFRDQLIYVLANTGVKTDFVDELLDLELGVLGTYSTINPELAFNSLYTLITVANKDREGKPLTENEKLNILKEETGHLIVGIAENSPQSSTLFKRFIDLLKRSSRTDIKNVLISSGNYTSEAADKIVNDALFDIESNDNAIREVAGRIIALQLQKTSNIKVTKEESTSSKDYKGIGKKVAAGTIAAAGLGAAIATGGVLGVGVALTSGALSLITLSGRLKNIITNLFSYAKNKLTKNNNFNLEESINKDNIIREATNLAEKFMNLDLGDVGNALKTSEELHHLSIIEARVANRLTTSFKTFIRTLKNSGLSPKSERALYEEISKAVTAKNLHVGMAKRILENPSKSGRPEGIKDTADALISKGYYNMISTMLSNIKGVVTEMQGDLLQFLLSDNFESRLKSGELALIPDLNEKVKATSQLLALLRMCKEVNFILNTFDTSEKINEEMSSYNIRELQNDISNMMENIAVAVDSITKQTMAAAFVAINGGHHYIETGMRLVRKNRKVYLTDEVVPGLGSNKVTIEELLDGVSNETGLIEEVSDWGLWFQKMGSSVDIINQLVSNLYDYNKAEANKEMYRYSQLLLDFHERVKETLGKEDTSFMCEKNKAGEYTGNIVLPDYDYGSWEDAYKEFIEEEKKKFREANFDRLSKMDLYQRGQELYEYLQPLIEDWHKKHSLIKPDDYINILFETTPFEETGPKLEYLPGKEFASDQWEKLSQEQKDFVREYVGIKQSLDLFVEEYHPHSITSYRLPQFRGTTISRMKHKHKWLLKNKVEESLMNIPIYRTLHDQFIENFFEDALDEDFGDNSCYNNEDDTFFEGASLTDREYLRRIPVFGVNKLKDRYNMSTDLVLSTMLYAAMALNVKHMATTASILVNGQEVLKKRQIGGSVESTKNSENSRNYRRFIKFLEMLVFNIRSNKFAILDTKGGRTLLANKIMSWMSKEGSWWLLAGKLASGTVNTGTGLLQIWSEASVGEHFTRKELIEGLIDYYKYAAEANFREGLAPLNRSNKYYSFIRYYDSLNNNESYFKDFTSHMQLGKWSQFRKVQYAMWVYESGNHLMQSLPYRLKGKHTKLYLLKEGVEPTEENLKDSNNFIEKGNIWDNFDEAQLQRGKNVLRFKEKREEESGKPYVNEGPTMFISEELETGMWGNPYRDNYYIKTPNGSFVLYDRIALSRFQTQCRYMTDNMHGIYNNPDALAISQSVLGASILTMKKYLFGYSDKLYLTDRYSVADGRNTEGAVITWLKMLLYYHGLKGPEAAKQLARIYSMGAPIIASFGFQLAGNSQMLSTIMSIAYGLISSSGRINKNLGVKGIQNRMALENIAEYQRYNIKRFDTYVKVALFLRTISNLLSNSLWGHSVDEDDDSNKVELNWGENFDAGMLKLFGYDEYEEAIKSQITKENGELKEKPKDPGLLYTIVDYELNKAVNESEEDKAKKLRILKYNMGTAYYFMHRWHLESETLFPIDLYYDSFNNNIVSEVKTLLAQYANIFPVGPSFMWGLGDAGLACFDANKPVDYKYDKEAESFLDVYARWGDWDEEEVPTFLLALAYEARTLQHLIAGDNKGFNKLIQMAPYMNGIGPIEDWYIGSKRYDFGRKMTTH